MDCATCEREASLEPVARWKAPLLFVGVLLFCPCHLPATFAVVAAVGGGLTGAAWLFGNQPLVYLAFGSAYLVLLVLFLRWIFAQRERERWLERVHATHAPQA